MFGYRKRFLFPIHISHPDERFAARLLEILHGPEGEFASFVKYLLHCIQIDHPYIRDLLGMIAAEELGHWEMIGVVIKKLTDGALSLAPAGVSVDPLHHEPLNPVSQPQADLLSALKEIEELENKARKKYISMLDWTDDPHLKKMIQFLIRREMIHQKLIARTINLVAADAKNEQFLAVIREYRMSLRVVN